MAKYMYLGRVNVFLNLQKLYCVWMFKEVKFVAYYGSKSNSIRTYVL